MSTSTPSTHPAGPTLREGRRRFFSAQGFPADGGYDDPWAEASFGPFPYAVPNTRARADALRVHDLHHVLTGYPADWRSESRISAWELGSGDGGRYPYAWFIALFGLFVGLLTTASSVWRAFLRGRGSTNLYREADPRARLPQPIAEVRRALAVRELPRRATLRDRAVFGLWALASAALAVIFVLGAPLLVLLALARRMCPCQALRRCAWSGTSAAS